MNFTEIKIKETALRSRQVRIKNTQSLGGVRTIDVSASSDGNSEVVGGTASPTGIIQKVKNWIIDKAKQFPGFLWSKIVNFIKFSLTQVWGTIVSAYFTLKTFNWNQSDDEIQKQIDQNNKRLLDAAGGGLGKLAAWGLVSFANLAVGAALGAVGRLTGNSNLKQQQTVKGIKIPVVSARIAAALAEEGGEEIRGAFTNFFTQGKSAMISNGLLTGLLTARKMKLFGQKEIGPNANLPVDSFIDKQQKWIESLPVKWQEFAEEFIEEFEESIVEAGYIVSHTLDDHYAAHRLANKHIEEERNRIILDVKP